MAKDEMGSDPVARDGDVDDDLERRRRERNGSGKGAANGGGSIADRAAEAEAPEIGEGDDGQMFVWEQGRKVTLSTLYSNRVPVEHVFVFGGKRVKGKGGLMSLEEQPILVVRGQASGVKIVPTHDEDGKVTKVVIETHVAAQIVNAADSDEAMALLAPIIEKRAAADAA